MIRLLDHDEEVMVNGKRYLKPDHPHSPNMRLTDCCGAYSTYHDEDLSCKHCWHSVEVGEGDGCEFLDSGHVDDFDARA